MCLHIQHNHARQLCSASDVSRRLRLQGYAERKVLLLCDVVKAARELHAAGAKQERAKAQAACRQVGTCSAGRTCSAV